MTCNDEHYLNNKDSDYNDNDRVNVKVLTNDDCITEAGVKCEVRSGKMRGTGARYQCEANGNLRGWNVRDAEDNWRSRRRYRM